MRQSMRLADWIVIWLYAMLLGHRNGLIAHEVHLQPLSNTRIDQVQSMTAYPPLALDPLWWLCETAPF